MEIIINNSPTTINKIKLPLTYKVNDGDNIITGSSSKTFRLPATPENQIIFDWVEDTNSTGVTQNNKPTAVIFDDGIELMRGFCKVQKINIGKSVEYEISVISDNREWANSLKQLSFTDEDFSDGDHSLTYGQVLASETGVLVGIDGKIKDWILYPVVNYGELKGISHNTFREFSIKDRFPMFKVKEFVYRFFKTQGFKISSDFYDDVLDKIYLPCVEDFLHTESFRTDKLFSVKMSADQTPAAATETTIEYDTENFDNGNDFNTGTYQYTADAATRQDIRAVAYYENTDTSNWDTGTLRLKRIRSGATTTIDSNSFSIPSNTTPDHYKTVEVNNYAVLSGDIFYATIEFEQGLSSVISNSTIYNDVSLEYNILETVEVENLIPNINQLAFIQGLKDEFNLRFYTDSNERIVYFEPEEQFYNGSEVDISNKIDYNKTIEESFFSPAKKYEYKYTTDSNDKFLEEYNKLLDNPLGYGSESMLNQFGNESSTKTSLFSATYMGSMEQGGFIQTQIPRLWNQETLPAASTKFNLRLLYYDGVKNTENSESWVTTVYNALGTIVGNLTRTTYPKVYFYDLNSVNQNSLLYNDEAGSVGLITKYHKYRLNRLNNSRILTLNLNLTADFINTFSFRDYYRIESAQNPEINGNYHILEISDYVGGSTRVQLMQVPSSDPIIDTAADDIGDSVYIPERSVNDGFNSVPNGVKLMSKGDKIAEYSESYGFIGDGFPMTIEIGADEPITYEMYIEVNEQEVKMTI